MNLVNTSTVERLANVEANLRTPRRLLAHRAPHARTALIVGGGPSLASSLPDLQRHRARGGVIFACNGAPDWLAEHGIATDFHLILDARQDNARFLDHIRPSVIYLLAAQCHPDLFAKAPADRTVTWVPHVEGLDPERWQLPLLVVCGGSTVGLKALQIAWLLGYRRIRCFGLDGCYSGDTHHAYQQQSNDADNHREVNIAGKAWRVAPWMEQQADDFRTDIAALRSAGCAVIMHGDGLLAHLARVPQMENAA